MTNTPADASGLRAVADVIAHDAHGGQMRRHGAHYIDHPRAVCALAEDVAHAVGLPFSEADAATALLHDVLEDCPRYSEASLAEQVGEGVAARVTALTKTGKGEAATANYYAGLMTSSPMTRLIKVADRLHNLSELHKAHSEAKLTEYVAETNRFVRPLCDGFDAAVSRGLRGAVDDAIHNARRNGAFVGDGRVRGERQARQQASGGLYAILSPAGDTDALLARLDAIVRGGATRVQLRVKPDAGLTDSAWLNLLVQVARVADAADVDVVVNDRADLAFAARLQGLPVGVHLGDADLPPRVARAMLGPSALVGTSTHSGAQLRTMDAEGSACHLALGPIWASPTKAGHADVVGTAALRAACAHSRRPVVAIGGITTPARAAEAVAAGAAFVAVVSALAGDDTDDVHAVARRFALSIAAARAAL